MHCLSVKIALSALLGISTGGGSWNGEAFRALPRWIQIAILATICFLTIFIFALKVFQDAQNRGKENKEAFLWFLATFVFFAGAIVWVFVRPPFIEDEPTHFCHECKTIFHGDHVCCPECGHVLIGEVVDQSSMGEDE
jgi:hypothetical protein